MDIRKDYFADERSEEFNEIGRSKQRSDTYGHVKGMTPFYADRNIPGLLHLRMVRSPYHHARILRIDISAAEQYPGVARVITAKDVPHNVYTILSLINVGPEDEPVLAFDKVRWLGEPVVAVVADSERGADEAAALVRIDYQELVAVFDVEEALKPGAPLVNEYHGRNYYRYDSGASRKVKLGDVQAGFRTADCILEERYEFQSDRARPDRNDGCIVVPDQNKRLTCYTGTQAIFFTLDNSSIILDVPGQRLHFVGGAAGGGFGGKVDCTVEPITLLAVMLTGRPVAFIYNRYEEMQISSTRAAERIYIKDGVMNDGRIVARQVRCYLDAGAYSRHSPYGAQKSAAHFPGPYTIPNVEIDCYCVYTNRTPSSSMRGFGVTIGDFAIEVQMDKLARVIGMNPLEFRFINAYRDGEMKAHRQLTEGAALIECMQEASIWAGWPVEARFLKMSSREKRG